MEVGAVVGGEMVGVAGWCRHVVCAAGLEEAIREGGREEV